MISVEKDKPMKVTTIFGEAAVERYNETGKIPSAGWLKKHSGEVCVKEFKTEVEFEAYASGVKDCLGWNDYSIIKPELVSDVR